MCMQPGMGSTESGETVKNPYLEIVEKIYPDSIPKE